MYIIKPSGINIKDNDRNVKDRFLQESINLQWRDGSVKPIPERLLSAIDTTGYEDLIFHKVTDENQINVLGFKRVATDESLLASDVAGTLGGNDFILSWFGTIIDGVYAPIAETLLFVYKSTGMSFTFLNGILYFMGDGSTVEDQFYLKLQFLDTGIYELKDLYKWKTLIPFYPEQSNVFLTAPNDTNQVFSQNGVIATRFALVLKSGEIVLHSPIYAFMMYGLNVSSAAISKDDIIENIHTFINLNLEFLDAGLLDEEISAINVYTSVPYYETKFTEDYPVGYNSPSLVNNETVKGELQKMAESPFYLIKTIESPTDDKLLLTVGQFSTDIEYDGEYSKLDISTIAAGEVMPVDNFTYHSIYGKITTYNGRLIVSKPQTVLSGGHIRALALENQASDVGFKIETEDGDLDGIAYFIDKALGYFLGAQEQISCRGILSYPDARGSFVGGSIDAGGAIRLFKSRKNALHNMSCAFDIKFVGVASFGVAVDALDPAKLKTFSAYSATIIYFDYDEITAPAQAEKVTKYISDNRVQFSSAGEFSVWPAINSYRVGEGIIISVSSNAVNPGDADIIVPLLVGTTDGIHSINTDPTGNNLVSSITRVSNLPFLSAETLAIDDNLIFVSDKGLMAIRNSEVVNLTKDFFPEQGDGNFPLQETVYPNYDILTVDFFGAGGNPYVLIDIVDYMRGAIFAFDSRRDNIWCSNPSENFSLIYNTKTSLWGMSTFVFNYKAVLYAIIDDVYSRFMVKNADNVNMVILSGEDTATEVQIHMLSRPMKFQNPNSYKKIGRMFARCVLRRIITGTGYFTFGLWGKQDVQKDKKSIPLVALKGEAESFPDEVRYDIPVSTRKGKYKSITVLLSGKVLPDSDIDNFEFEVKLVDNSQMR